MSKSQTKPETGKWIEEDISVRELVPEVVGDGVKYTYKDKIYKQKTMYVDAPKKKIACAFVDHEFVPDGPNKFKCENCTYVRIAHPVTWKYNPVTKKLDPR